MRESYAQGKDLYANIASSIYHNNYEDNLEFHSDGSPNPDGKKRRSSCKSVLLGIMYGRGSASVAEQIGTSVQEAQQIIDNFYKGFPQVKEWMDKGVAGAKVNGYVEDLWGRRRRLPDIQLPKYTIKNSRSQSSFNPILYCKGLVSNPSDEFVEKYRKKLSLIRGRNDYNKLKDEAFREGIYITDNGGFISQAERQCINSQIQGSAATMTKICMRKVFDNEALRNLDAHLVLQIHDEVIMECPKENAEKVAEILSEIMKTCVSDSVDMPFKADCEVSTRWYEHDMADNLQKEFKDLQEKMSLYDAKNELLKKYTEFLPEELDGMLNLE